jgi:PTS system nitrogen regulatory IIA component
MSNDEDSLISITNSSFLIGYTSSIDIYKKAFTIKGMSFNTSLTKDTICLHLKGSNKQTIISELLDILVSAGQVKDRDAALASIMDRESKMSTGMKHGIAIPHGKTSSVDDLVVCIGISDNPVDFEALDGEPCRIFIMTLSPLEKTGPHLQFLAEISLLFKSPEKRAEMLASGSPDEILRILSG